MARLVVISNRVAVPSGTGSSRAGGLEVAVRATLKGHSGVWFGWSGRVAASGKVATQTVEHDNHSYIVTDLTDKFDQWMVEEMLNLLFKIFLICSIHFCCNFQRYACSFCDFYCPVRPLLGRYPSEKGKIISFAIPGTVHVLRQSMINCIDPVYMRQWFTLII